MRRTAIDLFSGAGGISLGLEDAGYEVLLASDIDAAAAATHRLNFPKTLFWEGDVHDLQRKGVRGFVGLGTGELDLLMGGPPCQGFSIIGARRSGDPRNDLFRPLLGIARELQPKCIVIENVPGLLTFERGRPLEAITAGLRELGYDPTFAELLAAQYGAPQMRWRFVMIAFRGDLGMPRGMGFPVPTHGRRGIGELIPNCTVSPEDMAGFLTTRDAIGDLPPVEPGQEVCAYTARPTRDYQIRCREGAGEILFNHYAPRLSARNIERIAALRPGQDWRDLPRDLLPEGMKRAKRKDHTRRYRRMTWEGVPRSIITRFRDPKSGEYSHPDQDRTITIREAARIQGFPDRFVFKGTYSELYDQVGNAVPSQLARAIGLEIGACLEGSASHVLQDAFKRRPSVCQTRLALDGA